MLSILHPSSPGRRYCYSHFIEGDLGLKILGRLIGLTQVILLELRHHLRLSGTKHEFKDFFNLTFLKRQYIHSVQNFKTTYKCTKKPQTLFYPLSPPIDRQYNKLPKDLSKRYIMHILANRGCVCVCVCVLIRKHSFVAFLLWKMLNIYKSTQILYWSLLVPIPLLQLASAREQSRFNHTPPVPSQTS